MKRIVFFGDSITDADRDYDMDGFTHYGYGFVNVVANTLINKYEVINRGISGNTVINLTERYKKQRKIRNMQQQDIPAVLSLMRPFIEKKILLPRTYESLMASLNDYIVFELDENIRACASLHVYPDNQAEISGVAVDESFSKLGIGPKLINNLLDIAKSKKISKVFYYIYTKLLFEVII